MEELDRRGWRIVGDADFEGLVGVASWITKVPGGVGPMTIAMLLRNTGDALGRIDVVLAPVDGGYTLNVDDMILVLQQINAPLVIPMHFFGTATLQLFVSRLGEHFSVETSPIPVVTLSRATLPVRPTVLVLPGY